MKPSNLERIIAKDEKGYFTILTLLAAITMLANSITLLSPIVELPLAVVYFLINSIFCGSIFFREETTSFRIAFGLFVLLMLIALGSASVIVANALFPIRLDMKAITAILSLISILLSITKHTRINTWLNRETEE